MIDQHLPQALKENVEELRVKLELKPKRDQLQSDGQNMIKTNPNVHAKHRSIEEGELNILPEGRLVRRGLEMAQM